MHTSLPSYKDISLAKNFLVLVGILFTSYASVWLFSERPTLATIPITFVGVLFLCYVKSWKLLVVAFLFAFLGAAHEVFFILQGFWSYTTQSFFFIPLYLPFIWGNISILSVALFKGILILDHKNWLFHNPPLFWNSFLFTFLGIVVAPLCIFFFASTPLLLAGIFLCIDILYVIAMRSVPLAIVGLVALIMGSVADLVAVPLGIWQYPLAGTIAGIPPYIFIGWDITALLIIGFYLTFDAPDAPWARQTSMKTIEHL
jgi:hypothetical protein